MGRKISDICLKQGQGMRGRATPPQPVIHRVPPPGLKLAKKAGKIFSKSFSTQIQTA